MYMYTEIRHYEDVSIIFFIIKTGVISTKALFNTESNFTIRISSLYSCFQNCSWKLEHRTHFFLFPSGIFSGKYLSVMLVNCLCSCLTSLTCWFLWASECKKYNISGTLFTKHPLITVANNNLLFKKIYIYFIVVVLNRLKYLVKTTWHCNSIKEPCYYFIQQFMQMPSFRVHSSETMFPPKVTLSQAYK